MASRKTTAAQQTPAPEAPEIEGDTVTVTCLVKAGRRRAGRRWEGGATTLPADDLSEDQIDALRADPMFALS